MKIEQSTGSEVLSQVLQSAQEQQSDLSQRLLKVAVGDKIDLTSLDTMGKLFDERA